MKTFQSLRNARLSCLPVAVLAFLSLCFTLFPALSLAQQDGSTGTAVTTAADARPDVTAPRPDTVTPDTRESARAFVDALPPEYRLINNLRVDFYEQFPVLKGVVSRIGNSHSGIAPEKRARFQTDSAHIRTSWPATLYRVFLETHRDGSQLLATWSLYGEGRWSYNWWKLTGEYVGGTFGFNPDDRDPPGSNQAYGSYLLGYDATGYFGEGNPLYDAGQRVTLTEIPINDSTTVPGYSWTSSAVSCELRTPYFHGYSVDPFDAAIPDPTNPARMFTARSVFRVDWSKAGDGREYISHQTTLDPLRYPTNPLNTRVDQQHIERLVKIGSTLHMYSGANGGGSVLVHKWDDGENRMIPYLAMYTFDNASEALAGRPVGNLESGRGLVWRDANGDGISQPGEFTVYLARQWGDNGLPLYYLWNNYKIEVDPKGVVYFLPFRDGKSPGEAPDTRPVLRWNPLDLKKPVPSQENLDFLTLPDALVNTTDAIESIKINWKSGDLFAVVRRPVKSGGEIWCLERYAGWLTASEKTRKAKKPVYSVGQIGTNVRRSYESMSPYTQPLESSWEPKLGSMKGAIGALLVEGDFVAVIEAQACAVRLYRAKDGSVIGRKDSPGTPNATQDSAGAAHMWLIGNKLRISAQDFHGGTVTYEFDVGDLK